MQRPLFDTAIRLGLISSDE